MSDRRSTLLVAILAAAAVLSLVGEYRVATGCLWLALLTLLDPGARRRG